jgi:hypothetical protein
MALPLVKKFSEYCGIWWFILEFTTARLNLDYCTVYSRKVLILYSPLSLVHPMDHWHSIPPLKPISDLSFIFHSCKIACCQHATGVLIICSSVNLTNITTFLCTNQHRQLSSLFQLTARLHFCGGKPNCVTKLSEICVRWMFFEKTKHKMVRLYENN